MGVYKASNGQWSVDLKDTDGKNYTFEFSRWGAEEQTDTLIDLIKVAGPSLGGVVNVFASGNPMDLDLGSEAIEKLLRTLTTDFTRDKELTKKLLIKLASDRVIVNGANVNYNEFYRDRLTMSYAVIRAHIEVQYGNFFDAVAPFIAGPSSQAASDQSPTSTGGIGGP